MDTPYAEGLPRSGDRFVLRRLSGDDLREFQAYRQDAELGRYQGWSPMSDEDAAAFLGEMSTIALFSPGNWTQLAIADPRTRCLIGDIGIFLDPHGRHAEIGFTLARHAQGRGLATAAVAEAIRLVFAATGVARIIGITDARNTASIQLLERVGMRKAKTTQAVFRAEPCVEFEYVVQRHEG